MSVSARDDLIEYIKLNTSTGAYDVGITDENTNATVTYSSSTGVANGVYAPDYLISAALETMLTSCGQLPLGRSIVFYNQDLEYNSEFPASLYTTNFWYPDASSWFEDKPATNLDCDYSDSLTPYNVGTEEADWGAELDWSILGLNMSQ
jgi:hypothetical protein